MNKTISSITFSTKLKTKNRDYTVGHRVPGFIFLIIWSIYILIPFYIMFNLSIKTNAEASYSAFTWWPQQGITFDAYKKVFSSSLADGQISILRGFANTLLYNVPTICIGLFVGTLAAYAWSKLNWKSKKWVYGFLMVNMFLPDIAGSVTSYLLFETLGWTGSPLPLIIPGFFCGISQVFFIKQFMTKIPFEIVEAARIDGYNEFQIFFKFIFPLSLPAVGTQFILVFIACYNAYLAPLIYLEEPSQYTLQIALHFISDTYKRTDLPVVMASNIIATIPVLVLYIFTQKYILKGLNMGSGLKG